MQKIQIQTPAGRSKILIGEAFDRLAELLPGGKTVFVTDKSVAGLYESRFPPGPVIRVEGGEAHKTLQTVQKVYEALIDAGADRSSYIVGIGGGIVCDVAGYAAATYMRGVGVGFVATTLLAQVDASVGGKNGVNLRGYKNIVGTFRQPDFVLCDPKLLRTLPAKEAVNGLAEVVKHGAIGDPELFGYLEAYPEAARNMEETAVERMVSASVTFKAEVVRRDEKERGERRILNFGHTLGHALEKVSSISHGEAVSVGMVAASAWAAKRGLLPKKEATRISRLLESLGLPVTMEADTDAIMDAISKDKKREGDRIHFVFLRRIGEAVVEPISLAEAEKMVRTSVAFKRK
jgi:3-dehydroquinate synthase